MSQHRIRPGSFLLRNLNSDTSTKIHSGQGPRGLGCSILRLGYLEGQHHGRAGAHEWVGVRAEQKEFKGQGCEWLVSLLRTTRGPHGSNSLPGSLGDLEGARMPRAPAQAPRK